MMGIHLRPHPPCHAAPSATLASSMLLCNGRGKPWLRLPVLARGLKTQTGKYHQGPVLRCTTDRPCEPSPEEDPRDAQYRKFRDDMDKFAREYGAALRALGAGTSQDVMLIELEATLFRDEEDKLRTYEREISSDRCILATAHLIIGASSKMSSHTVEQITRTYVSTFLSIAEETCRRKVDRTSIISFLDALRGLAAISHILFEDALIAVNNIKDGSSNDYSTECNVEALKHELERNMKELVMKFTVASEKEAYELLCRRTLTNATGQVTIFVMQMTDLRRKVLAHVEARANDKDQVDLNDKGCTDDREGDDATRELGPES